MRTAGNKMKLLSMRLAMVIDKISEDQDDDKCEKSNYRGRFGKHDSWNNGQDQRIKELIKLNQLLQ